MILYGIRTERALPIIYKKEITGLLGRGWPGDIVFLRKKLSLCIGIHDSLLTGNCMRVSVWFFSFEFYINDLA